MATPAQAGPSQNGSLDFGPRGNTHPAAPARMNPGATDDEILGLPTNVRRRDSNASHGLPGAESGDPSWQEMLADLIFETMREKQRIQPIRVVGEIYRELDSTLRSNRTLTQQCVTHSVQGHWMRITKKQSLR
jgi:hypothetical protein